jgi:HSP20 family molecular chaperone IbpA
MNIREIGRSVGETVTENVGRAAGRLQEATPLSADVLESDDAYLAVFDAPGAAASDLQVRYEEGEVLVRVDRFREFREGYEMRYPGRGLALDGAVELPGEVAVDPDGATATLRDDGTLAVEIPKRDDPADAGDDTEEDHESGADDNGDGDESGGSDVEVTGGSDENAEDGHDGSEDDDGGGATEDIEDGDGGSEDDEE